MKIKILKEAAVPEGAFSPKEINNIVEASKMSGVSPAWIAGMTKAESGGNCLSRAFNAHLLRKATRLYGEDYGALVRAGLTKPDRVYSDHKKGSNSYFHRAYKIAPKSAVRVTAWGTNQVMGWELLRLGGLSTKGPGGNPDAIVSAFFNDPCRISSLLIASWVNNSVGSWFRGTANRAARTGNFADFRRTTSKYLGKYREGYTSRVMRYSKIFQQQNPQIMSQFDSGKLMTGDPLAAGPAIGAAPGPAAAAASRETSKAREKYSYSFGEVGKGSVVGHNQNKSMYGASMNKPILAFINLVLAKEGTRHSRTGGKIRRLNPQELNCLISYSKGSSCSNRVNRMLSDLNYRPGKGWNPKFKEDYSKIRNEIGISEKQAAEVLKRFDLNKDLPGVHAAFYNYSLKKRNKNKQTPGGYNKFISLLINLKNNPESGYSAEADEILKYIQKRQGGRGAVGLKTFLNKELKKAGYGTDAVKTLYGKGGYVKGTLNYSIVVNDKYVFTIYSKETSREALHKQTLQVFKDNVTPEEFHSPIGTPQTRIRRSPGTSEVARAVPIDQDLQGQTIIIIGDSQMVGSTAGWGKTHMGPQLESMLRSRGANIVRIARGASGANFWNKTLDGISSVLTKKKPHTKKWTSDFIKGKHPTQIIVSLGGNDSWRGNYGANEERMRKYLNAQALPFMMKLKEITPNVIWFGPSYRHSSITNSAKAERVKRGRLVVDKILAELAAQVGIKYISMLEWVRKDERFSGMTPKEIRYDKIHYKGMPAQYYAESIASKIGKPGVVGISAVMVPGETVSRPGPRTGKFVHGISPIEKFKFDVFYMELEMYFPEKGGAEGILTKHGLDYKFGREHQKAYDKLQKAKASGKIPAGKANQEKAKEIQGSLDTAVEAYNTAADEAGRKNAEKAIEKFRKQIQDLGYEPGKIGAPPSTTIQTTPVPGIPGAVYKGAAPEAATPTTTAPSQAGEALPTVKECPPGTIRRGDTCYRIELKVPALPIEYDPETGKELPPEKRTRQLSESKDKQKIKIKVLTRE